MSERKIKLDDVIFLIREQLNNGQMVTFSPNGTSMLPFLKEGRDTVMVSLPSGKLKKYDVALYQRKNGQYVLHRVVKVKEDYTFAGDNQFTLEKGVSQDQIIAVCTTFVRKGKRISAKDPYWRMWATFWHCSRFARYVFVATINRISRLFKGKI